MLYLNDLTFAFLSIYLQCKVYSVHITYNLQILSEVEQVHKYYHGSLPESHLLCAESIPLLFQACHAVWFISGLNFILKATGCSALITAGKKTVPANVAVRVKNYLLPSELKLIPTWSFTSSDYCFKCLNYSFASWYICPHLFC